MTMLDETYNTVHQLCGLSAPERALPQPANLHEVPRQVSICEKESTLQVLCEDCIISQVTKSTYRIRCC